MVIEGSNVSPWCRFSNATSSNATRSPVSRFVILTPAGSIPVVSNQVKRSLLLILRSYFTSRWVAHDPTEYRCGTSGSTERGSEAH